MPQTTDLGRRLRALQDGARRRLAPLARLPLLRHPLVRRWGATAVGALAIALLIWFPAQLVAVGGSYPFETAGARLAAILVEAIVLGAVVLIRQKRRNDGAEGLVRGMASHDMASNDSDATVLAQRMAAALATLKGAEGGRANYLYDLPWYVLIGPPGSGKTTALVNSGLQFPLAGRARPSAIPGVGGTRYCDWWFTDDAVLIDTAGRYTTQDSDAAADQRSWHAFLDLLKRNRPRQPINGVLVAISLEDLLTLKPDEVAAHAGAIRARLVELHERLKVDFPVYALFTKADLVIGFREYFADYDEAARSQVWGATFQTNDKSRNLVGDVPEEFEALLAALNAELPRRLETETDAANRVLLYGFPAQMAVLKNTVADFLAAVFDPAVYTVNAALRGFYFTSGTQEGTPIDQLLGALTKSFGAEGIATPAYSGQGKSFFLTDLVKSVVIGEAGWVMGGRRERIVRLASFAGIGLLTLVLGGAIWMAYARNADRVAEARDAVAASTTVAATAGDATTVSDHNLAKVLPILHALRFLPGGYGDRPAPAGAADLGLNQDARLRSAADLAYGDGLEHYLRPRLIERLEEQLQANANDPANLADALKVYLMLGGLKTADRGLISNWMERDWAEVLYPGAQNADGRHELEQHLAAMLDLEAGHESPVALNGPLVERCQATLARVNVARRAFDILETRAKLALRDDWTALTRGGSGAAVVFDESVGDVRVPYFFTKAGYQQAFLDRLAPLGAEMRRDRWVLGRAGEQPAVAAQYDALQPQLIDLYAQSFIAAWQTALGKLQVRNLTSERPLYPLLEAAAAPTSPMTLLLESVRDETTLAGLLPRPVDASQPIPPVGTSGASPAALIATGLLPYTRLVEADGSQRPIDKFTAHLGEARTDLSRFASTAAQADESSRRLTLDADRLQADATTMPQPFARMAQKTSSDVVAEMANAAAARTARLMRDSITFACQDLVASRYPFTRDAEREVALDDFTRLFGPNGPIDKFATENILPIVDTSGGDWQWRGDQPLARQLSPTVLADFQRAAQIRDAFFAKESTTAGFAVSIAPPPDATVRMEVDATLIAGRRDAAPAVTVAWPGSSDQHRAAVTFAAPGRGPATLERRGLWALFRLLDAGQMQSDGSAVSFAADGRTATFRLTSDGATRPLDLGRLRAFHCPSGA